MFTARSVFGLLAKVPAEVMADSTATNLIESLKIEAENQTHAVGLPVGGFGRVVHVLVVGLDFRPPADGEDAADVFGCPTPLRGVAVVVSLGAHVRREVVGTIADTFLHHQPVAIAPRELSVNQPQVGSVPIGNRDARI